MLGSGGTARRRVAQHAAAAGRAVPSGTFKAARGKQGLCFHNFQNHSRLLELFHYRDCSLDSVYHVRLTYFRSGTIAGWLAIAPGGKRASRTQTSIAFGHISQVSWSWRDRQARRLNNWHQGEAKSVASAAFWTTQPTARSCPAKKGP